GAVMNPEPMHETRLAAARPREGGHAGRRSWLAVHESTGEFAGHSTGSRAGDRSLQFTSHQGEATVMNKSLPWISFLLVSILAPAAVAVAQDEPSQPLAIGATAPMADAKLKSVDGRSLAITDAAGKKGTLV